MVIPSTIRKLWAKKQSFVGDGVWALNMPYTISAEIPSEREAIRCMNYFCMDYLVALLQEILMTPVWYVIEGNPEGRLSWLRSLQQKLLHLKVFPQNFYQNSMKGTEPALNFLLLTTPHIERTLGDF